MAFARLLEAAIKTSKRKKAPDTDKIRVEMLQLSPELFVTPLIALWRAVGRLQCLSSIFRSGTLVPIHKKGDTADRGNYRPITLLSVFRRVITKALSAEFRDAYSFHPAQWGLLRSTNTEVAIAAATNAIRSGRKTLAVLDLARAYDRVPRAKPLVLCRHRLPAALSAQVSALVAPTVLKTQEQVSGTAAIAADGVLQGDPISRLIFDLYMNPLLERLSIIQGGEGKGFADDVILLAASETVLQQLLDQATRWARLAGMAWNTKNSELIGTKNCCRLAGAALGITTGTTYLGITLKKRGVQQEELISRLDRAQKSVAILQRVTSGLSLSPRQRGRLVKSFIYPVMDYVTILQPLFRAARLRDAQLSAKVAEWWLQINVSKTQATRGLALVELKPLELRRRDAALRAAAKFVGGSPSPHLQRCRNIMEDLGTLKMMFKESKDKKDGIAAWQREQQEKSMEVWRLLVTGRQWRSQPLEKLGAPALGDAISRTARRKAAMWYVNRLPVPEDCRPYLEELKLLL